MAVDGSRDRESQSVMGRFVGGIGQRVAFGFTMIELLVVIAVIGVLAVAVLATLNPVEQINKGRDTRTRSDAAEIVGAVERYFATQEEYPWNTVDGSDFDSRFVETVSSDYVWAQPLEDIREVKDGFLARLNREDRLFMFKDVGDNETAYACFQPASNSFKQVAAQRCQDGSTPVNSSANDADRFCVDRLGTVEDDNYICVP